MGDGGSKINRQHLIGEFHSTEEDNSKPCEGNEFGTFGPCAYILLTRWLQMVWPYDQTERK